MSRTVIFTKRSVLFVLLVSNSFNPLLAFEHKPYSIVKNKQQISSIEIDIKNILINSGLDVDAAQSKTDKLFKNTQYSAETLFRLYNTPELFTSKEMINEALSKYALFEKTLDFSSYSSLVGLVQSISLKPLDEKQLNAIKNISALNA